MQTVRFILVLALSGTVSGAVMGTANFALVEPYLEAATRAESEDAAASLPEERMPEFWLEYEDYREWQRGGAVLAGVLLGLVVSMLYGMVYVLYGRWVPGGGRMQRAAIVAGVMWAALYLVPFIKYPPVLPGDGDAATLGARTAWYLGLAVFSGVAAVSLHRVSLTLDGAKKTIPAAVWVAVVAGAIVAMPANPDVSSADPETLNGFRAMAAVTITLYWASLGLVFGALWRRFGRGMEVGTRGYGR